jgi:hypothetical protein
MTVAMAILINLLIIASWTRGMLGGRQCREMYGAAYPGEYRSARNWRTPDVGRADLTAYNGSGMRAGFRPRVERKKSGPRNASVSARHPCSG